MNGVFKHMESSNDREFNGYDLSPDIGALKAYSHEKLQLANDLKFIRDGLKALGRTASEMQVTDLMEKLADDRFVLAVLGQFKRGKSSLMNAIMGRELLPTGVLPMTSAITALRYGPDERLIVNYTNSSFPKELPLTALPEFVTESGNPGNRKNVKTVQVELPVPFLRRGVEFVDTPGIGSSIEANTATTYSFLPECDAVLFVTSVDTPIASVELDFLKKIRRYVHKLFFIVNKIDILDKSEQNKIIRYVTDTINEQAGYRPERIFPVSARLGMQARLKSDFENYRDSGIKALEETLAVFLSEEKQSAFLSAIAHKASLILTEEKSMGTFSELSLKAIEIANRDQKLISLTRDPFEVTETIVRAWQKIEGHNNFNGQLQEPDQIIQQIRNSDEPRTEETTIDLEADLTQSECPACRHIQKTDFQFFTEWQYQLGINENARSQFANDLGFCPLHTWQLMAVCSPHGASGGFAPLAKKIGQLLFDGGFPVLIGDMKEKQHTCKVCLMNRQAEKEYIGQLALYLTNQEGRKQYLKSQGLCLKHLHQLTDLMNDDVIKTLLIHHSAARFEEDAEDMQTFVLKRDTLRKWQQNKNEKEAYRRMTARWVGSRGVDSPWPEDGEI